MPMRISAGGREGGSQLLEPEEGDVVGWRVDHRRLQGNNAIETREGRPPRDSWKVGVRKGVPATHLGGGHVEVELAGEDAFLAQGLPGRGRRRRGGGGGHPPPAAEGGWEPSGVGEEPNRRGARPTPPAGESCRGSGARVTREREEQRLRCRGVPSGGFGADVTAPFPVFTD